MHYCEVHQVTRTVHTEGANMDTMTLEQGEEVQYRHKMNPRQRWKDGFRAIIKQTGNSAYKPEKDLNTARPRFKLCRIVDLAKDSWRVENDELKELRMAHPDLAVVLYNFYVCGELLRQVREPKAFGEIDNFLEQLIERPLEYFTDTEQRKLMGCYLTNLKLPHYMVGYYTYLLGSIGSRSCHDTTFNNMEAEGTVPLIFTVRSLLWTCSDMSEEFATALAKTDYIGYLATELQELAPRIQLIKETNFTLVSNLVTLCICAMLPENRPYFREQNVTSCLIPYLQSPATVVKILALLTISYIIDDSDNHLLLADDSSFDFIMGLLTQALGKQGAVTQGFTVGEILNGLLGLSRADENKAVMSKKGVIQLLVNIIESGTVEEQKPALKLAWQLAFLEENRELLKQEKSLVNNLRIMQTNDQNDELRHLATGILWVLEGRKLKNLNEDMLHWLIRPEDLGPRFIGPLSEEETRRIEEDHGEYLMLSYSWEDQRMALQIRDRLKAAGYNVWMDVDDLSGSTLEAMAEAVENATLVLVCVSEGYKESLACRTEAEYTYRLGKPIIPLRLQSGYRPDGWLGILTGTKLCFDFTPDNWLDDKMKELIRELGDRGKSKDVDSVDNFDGVDLRDWTRKEIVEWLTVHELFANKALKRLSAEDLNFLWFLYNRCPEYFFKYCRKELGISRLSDMRKLNDAMMSLG